jgi:hypothetical protein
MTSAFAACPDRNEYGLFPGNYTVFSFDTSCGSRSGNVSTGTMSCNSWPADQFDVGSGTVDYDMTVPSDRSGNHWSVQTYVDFNDPSSYSANGLSASVIVRHNGSVSYSGTIFIHTGDQGSMSCELVGTGYFSASPGDDIQVSYTGVNYTSGTTMRITPPLVFWNP